MMIGFWEALTIGGALILLFGAKKLPDLARGIGQGIRNFKGEMKGEKREDEVPTLPPGDRGAP
jgi:sec-independent protein translocase protein TatA